MGSCALMVEGTPDMGIVHNAAKYHSSWDWLMQAWKKIIDLNLKETEDMCIREPWAYKQDIRNALADCDIKKTFEKIVRLIEWHKTIK